MDAVSTLNDQDLVKRLLKGDDGAFESFFEVYFPRLYRFALARLGGNEQAAEEIVQSTLCQVVRKLHTFRGEAALFTWLCTFCRREVSAYYKRANREPQRILLVEEEPEIRAALESLMSAHGGDPEEELRRSELARLVQVALDHLPPRYGDALEWKYIHGLSVKEIAPLLDVSPKAAESLLTRARVAFREGFMTLMEGGSTGGRESLREAFGPE
jgi:RNA polymerase sigma-70 factor (ECF subfamily)